MAMSNYSGGFADGVMIRGVPLTMAHPGKVFWVYNGTALLTGQKNGSDGNQGTFNDPFATIDYAIGKCTAGRGDIIMVKPGHAESVTAAGGIALDVAGVALVGLGVGSARPTITFTTAAAASVTIDGNNTAIKNLLFVNDIDQQTHMLDITATGVAVENCEFREGSSKEALSFITADTADADSDDLYIRNCYFYAPTAGDANNAIELAKDFKRVRILDSEFYGDWDDAAIQIPAGGNAQIDLQIGRCVITNLLAGAYAIQINGTGSTGKIYDCRVETNALATAVDAGGLEVFNTMFHSGTDQTSAGVPVAPTQAALFVPGLGYKVSKSHNIATDNVDLFTVTGKNLITLITGEVTTVVATTTTYQLRIKTTNEAITAATTITTDADNTLYVVSGDTGDVMNGADAPTTNIAGTGKNNMPIVIGVAGGSLTIESDLDGAGTGVIAWDVFYLPLEAGASIVAA